MQKGRGKRNRKIREVAANANEEKAAGRIILAKQTQGESVNSDFKTTHSNAMQPPASRPEGHAGTFQNGQLVGSGKSRMSMEDFHILSDICNPCDKENS